MNIQSCNGNAPMRDGVHKSFLRGRHLRRLMRQCACEADWGDRTKQTAHDAMASEIRKEITPRFVTKLLQLFDSDSPFLFNPLDGYHSPMELGGKPTPMNGRLFEFCNVLAERGVKGREVVEEALRLTLDERSDANLRAMYGHWQKEAVFGIDPAMEECIKAFRSIDLSVWASRLADGTTVNNPRQRRRPPIDLEENIGI